MTHSTDRTFHPVSEQKMISGVTFASEILADNLVQSGTIKSLITRFREYGSVRAIQAYPADSDLKLTYEELATCVTAVGAALISDGVCKGERIGLHAENSVEWVITYLAVTSIGAVIVPIDIFLKKTELVSLCRSGDISRLFISESFFDKTDSFSKCDKDRPEIVCITNRESVSEKRMRVDDLNTFEGILERGKALVEIGSSDFEAISVEPDDPAAMIFMHDNLFAVLTHNGLMANACGEVMQYSEGGQYLKPGERWLATLPFHHTYPVMLGFLVPFLTGGSVLVTSKIKINTIVTLLAEAKINYFSTVPLIAKGIDSILETSMPDLSELKFVICGGAAIKRENIESLGRKGISLIQGYGLTEYSPVVSSNSPSKNRIGSIGYPIPGVQVEILDPDENGDGEIIVKGPSMMSGYYNLPDETDKAIDRDGWLHTGDIGRVDGDGFIYITGRLKRIIVNSGGKNIYPGEVEDLLIQSPIIDQVSVSMRFNADGDEYAHALIRPDIGSLTKIERETGKRLSDEAIRQLVHKEIQGISENVAHYKIPGEFEITHDRVDRKTGEEKVLFTGTVTGDQKRIGVETESAGQLINMLSEHIRENAAQLLSVTADDIDPDLNFLEYLDSVELTKLAEKLERELDIVINPVVLFDYKNIRDFSGYSAMAFRKQLERFFDLDTGTGFFAEIPETKEQSDSQKTIKTERSGPIAIVGASGRFPRSENLDQFWENLAAGKNLISEVPSDRFNIEDYFGDPHTGNRMNTRYGGFIDDIDKFDPLFFNISPREAALMDPQQRIFLEVAWETIEDAGCRPSSLSGTKTGLFVGVATHDYDEICSEGTQGIDAYSSTGYSHSILANRVSYFLDIRGPSESIDTACSGSLVAVHRAIHSIRSGECEAAIVGGVNALLTPKLFISFSKAGMLSPDGQCKTFSKGANGYVRGEGAGAVFLKPLDKAIADGNHIYGIIRDTAVNHGGKANSMTAPNPSAQAELLVSAYEKAAVPPETISYIEAHGTGTALGDPVEISGLNKAFDRLHKNAGTNPEKMNYCGLGSVKTNIGHLETGAGIAGLIKVILSLKNKTIPATLNFDELNPLIDLNDTPFYIADRTRFWEPLRDVDNNPVPRRAGVSSFGFGGSNAHVVLEEYKGYSPESVQYIHDKQVVVLSAKNRERLKAYAKRILHFIDRAGEKPDFKNLVYTLQTGRDGMQERLAIVAASMTELREKLSGYCTGKTGIESVYTGNGRKPNTVQRAGNPEHLAERWVSGEAIDWKKLYPNGTPGLVSLPTYPFEKNRYWVTTAKSDIQDETGSVSIQDKPETVESYTGGQLIYSTAQWVTDDAASETKPLQNPILIFDLNGYYSERLKGEGTVLILPGKQFKENGNNSYSIHPGKASDYQTLFDNLAGKNLLPRQILHLWAYESSHNFGIPLSAQLEKSIYSLFHISRQLIRLNSAGAKMLFAYRDGKELLHPQYAACAAFARTLSAECPDIGLKVVRVDSAVDAFDLADMVRDEFGRDDHHTEILYRDAQRFIKKQGEIGSENPPEKELPIKNKGVYLITGGMGGLGYLFATYLAETYRPVLILTGRSALDANMAEKITALKKLDADVHYIQGDISTASGASDLIGEIKGKQGRIDGVIHSAGLLKDGIIAQKETDQFRSVLAPKVAGTFYLDKAIGENKLDFFVMFSSVAAIVGNPGQADYAYGNYYMDRFAAWRNKRVKDGSRFGRTVSINWPLWRDGGMRVADRYLDQMKARLGFDLLDKQNGIKAFEKALTEAVDAICVAEGDIERLRKTLGITEVERVVEQKDIDTTEKNTVETGPIRDELKTLLADLLEMDSTAIDESEEFSEYGVDSILTMRLIEKVNTRWGLELESDDISDNPSVDKLAVLVVRQTSGGDVTTGESSVVDSRVENDLHMMLAALLEIESDRLDTETEFSDYGVDSIMTMRLVEQINTKWHIEITSDEISEHPTIQRLTGYLSSDVLNLSVGTSEKPPVKEERQPAQAPDTYQYVPYVEELEESEIDGLLVEICSGNPESSGEALLELAVNALSEEAIDRILEKQLATKAWYYNLI